MAGSSENQSTDPASMSATVSEHEERGTIQNSPDPFETQYGKQLIHAILEDCLYNIISDTVLKTHREEKQARMQSAAIIAQQAKDNAKAEASPGGEPQSITTAGAMIDAEDKIYLHDNPLRTTTEILCPTCRLPRLAHPTTGRGAKSKDPAKEYCTREPYIDKDGCDIYGKSLTLEKISKKKGPSKKEKAGSRSGSDSRENSPNPNGREKDKPAASTSIPSGKCPYCPRYMAFTRIAQHMDRCPMGPNSRAAKSGKLQSNTPQASSRASTPKPSSAQTTTGSGAPGSGGVGAGINGKKRKLEKSDDEEETTPVKKKKIVLGKKDKDGKVKALDPKIQRVKSGDKRPPGADEKRKNDD